MNTIRAIGRFFRAIVNPPYNNWMWLGSLGLMVTLFILAIKLGGGEPFLVETLRKAAERSPDPVEQFYHRSHAINQLPATHVSVPTSHGSWIWWKLAVGMLIFTIIFTPVAFHDEIGAAWNRAWERWEQRRRRIRLQPQPPPAPTAPAAGQPTITQTVGGTFLGRQWRRITEHFPGDLAGEFANDVLIKITRAIFRR